MKTTLKTLIAATLVAASVTPALAQDRNDDRSGAYFGVGAGRLNYQINELELDDDATTWNLFAGWRFNPYLALEAAYIDGGDIEQRYGQSVKVQMHAKITQLSLLPSYWFTPAWGVYGRASYNDWHAHGDGLFEDQLVVSAHDSGADSSWGVGVQGIYDRAVWRAEYTSGQFDEIANLNGVVVSVGWRF